MNDERARPPLPGALPGRAPEGAAPPADFSPRDVAKSLLRSRRAGTLATIDRGSGYPFASLVNVATDSDGSPLILVSRLSTHTANLEQDGRASVLLAETGRGDALTHPRLTVLGIFAPVARERADEPRLCRRFLSAHPKSGLYAGFGDFALWRMTVVSAHLNGGFGRAADLTAADVLTDISDAAGLIEAEPGIVTHMNDDHREAIRLYATKLLGARDGEWRCAGCDPDGLDLQLGLTALRLPFAQRVATPGAIRHALADLAAKARAI